MRGIVLFFFFFGIVSLYAETSKVKVLATIKPVAMLAYAIAGEEADISQLIPDYSSVHNYSFKPSDLRRIKNTDIIFRIDEHLETIFTPIFDALPSSVELISLAEEGGIKLLPRSKSGHDNKHGHDHENQHGNDDLHIWTSPKNAIKMAKTITRVLSERDPKNAKAYQKNLLNLMSSINVVSQEISQNLIDAKNSPYIVFHNSWRYFQRDFNLKDPAVISLNEGFIPDVKSIRNTRKKIKQSNVSCIFSDPSVSKAIVRTLIEGYDVKDVEIDSLGSGLKLQKSAYSYWLKTMGKHVDSCLSVVAD